MTGSVPSDNVAIFIGLVVAFGYPLAMLGLAIFIWLLYTIFTMARPVWIILYVLVRLFLYVTVWIVILSVALWLCGWSGPLHFFADIYAALPRGIYNWLSK